VPCILHLVFLVERPIDISTVGGKQKHMQVHARSGSDRQSCSMNELKSNVNDKKHLLLGKEEDPAILACYRRSALLCSSQLVQSCDAPSIYCTDQCVHRDTAAFGQSICSA
jgi:hypothetical protein